jgi:hypothetical protein
LLFWLVDTCFLFFPFRLLDPTWILLVVKGFVESSPVLLVGFVLAFFGERKPRLDWEFMTLKVLSWSTGVLSLFFILLIPCTLLVGFQVSQITQNDIGRSTQSQLAQIQTLRKNVANVQSPAQLQMTSNLLGLNERASSLGGNPPSLNKSREDILRRLKIQEAYLKNKNESDVTSQNLSTLKRSVKISLGSVMSSVLFFLIWRSTGWAR